MPSTFFGLYIAGSGLKAANAAMNTTANNISNADTEGYSKQVVVQEAASALRTFTTYGCAGAGVDTIAIERLRDSFYDTEYRNNETNYGESSVKSTYMELIENYFTDDGTTGFASIFADLGSALEEVLKNAGDSSTKTAFVSTAESLAEYFNNMAGDLQELQETINTEIKVQVDEINSIAEEIANLNKQINVIEMSGTTANELRDKRDALVDELSQIVDVDVTETDITDSNGIETGATRYILRIAGGQTIVDGNDYEQLTCVARDTDEKVNQSDAEGLYDIYWSNGNKFNTSNASMGGSLAGLLELRDGNNGEYFNGDVSSTDTTNNTVTIEVTADYLTDLNKSNLASAGKIVIDSTVYEYDSWTFDVATDASGNTTYSYTFSLEDSGAASGISVGDTSYVGGSIDYQGIPYYMEQMNEWVRNFSEAFNQILLSGYTDDGDEGIVMMTADYTSGDQGEFTDGTDIFYGTATSGSVTSTDDSYYLLTALNFTISDDIVADAELIATKSADSETEGESEYDNISAIIDMLSDETQMSFRGATAGDFLTSLLGDIALNANSADTFTANYETLQTTLENQRLSVSGVDADEEAVSLVDYQNTYTLASKVISTLTEMYDQLILNTGV